MTLWWTKAKLIKEGYTHYGKLWGIPVYIKVYSGITDDMFKVDDLTLAAMTFETPKEEEVILHFLQGDKEVFLDSLKKIEKKSKKIHLIADISDFNSLFELVFKAKSEMNILNTTEAIKAVVRLAEERLKQIEEDNSTK